MVPYNLAQALVSVRGETPKVLERLRAAASHELHGPRWRGLSVPARKMLRRAIGAAALAGEPIEASHVSIVDYPAESPIDAQYRSDGVVLLSRRLVEALAARGDEGRLVSMMIHEVCHRHGTDSSQGAHQQAVEAAWERLWNARSAMKPSRASKITNTNGTED